MGSNRLRYISVEGIRGLGKSTLIELLRNEHADRNPVTNRELRGLLPKSEAGDSSKRQRREWRQMMIMDERGLTFPEPENAEDLAWLKHYNMIVHISQRVEHMAETMQEGQLLIRDRYLDTTIVYDAADIIFSNPEKYSSETDRGDLLRYMWEQALEVCKLPPYTIYLTSEHPDAMLERSAASRDADAAYQIDPYQVACQHLATQLYQTSFAIRQELMPEHKVHQICVDGRSPDEIFQEVESNITFKSIITHE